MIDESRAEAKAYIEDRRIEPAVLISLVVHILLILGVLLLIGYLIWSKQFAALFVVLGVGLVSFLFGYNRGFQVGVEGEQLRWLKKT